MGCSIAVTWVTATARRPGASSSTSGGRISAHPGGSPNENRCLRRGAGVRRPRGRPRRERRGLAAEGREVRRERRGEPPRRRRQSRRRAHRGREGGEARRAPQLHGGAQGRAAPVRPDRRRRAQDGSGAHGPRRGARPRLQGRREPALLLGRRRRAGRRGAARGRALGRAPAEDGAETGDEARSEAGEVGGRGTRDVARRRRARPEGDPRARAADPRRGRQGALRPRVAPRGRPQGRRRRRVRERPDRREGDPEGADRRQAVRREGAPYRWLGPRHLERRRRLARRQGPRVPRRRQGRHPHGLVEIRMNRRIAVVVALAALVPAARAEDKIQTTEAVGQAAIAGDVLAAKEQAKDDAMRNCVQQVAGTVVTASTETDQAQLLSDKVFAHSVGYIRKFQVLDDKQDGNTWVTKLRCEVSEAKLDEDLMAFGIAYRRAGMPRIFVLIAEQAINATQATGWWQCGGNAADLRVMENAFMDRME